MNKLLYTAMAFAVLGLTAGANVATAAQKQASPKYECLTDDGYGRMRPCSAGYKRANPNWRSSNDCFTDEGNGRYRPCDSFIKRSVNSSN